MSEQISIPQVGAPDPEMKNSPIAEETDEDYDVIQQTALSEPVCYFNNTAYEHNSRVCTGDELLRCKHGLWLREGTCDPDNP